MKPDLDELGWAFIGTVVVGIGAGTATLAAFAPALPVVDGGHPAIRVGTVSVGFAIFFAGYGISQIGTHRDRSLDAVAPATGSVAPGFLLLRAIAIVLGLIGLGAGMRLFALTIQAWDPVLGVATGVVCIVGYIFGHIGINGVVL
ncbi:MAG: hypothetical protein ABEH64_07205 [Salinirussus sp.]